MTLNLLIWPQRWWSLFVLAGVGAGWATVAQAIRKRSSFCKHVLYQVVTVGIVVVLFDLMTGFGHWSFNYVIPALCVFAMVVIAIIAAMGHRSISNYIIYMVVSAVFGLIPLLFLLNYLFPLYGLAYAQAGAELVLSICAVIMLRHIFKKYQDNMSVD